MLNYADFQFFFVESSNFDIPPPNRISSGALLQEPRQRLMAEAWGSNQETWGLAKQKTRKKWNLTTKDGDLI